MQAGRIQKLVFFENAVETLGFFSRELAMSFTKWGYSAYFIDYEDLYRSMKYVNKFCKVGNTALITFNFIGLSGEEYCQEKDGRSMWETRDLPCYCILVDHPLYYHKQLNKAHKNLTVFCIDRQHVEYMNRFYPTISCYFLPLAGNEFVQKEIETIPYEDRAYEVAFIANYVPLPDLYQHFKCLTQEYIDFYYEIINDLIEHPSQRVDDTMEKFVLREIPEATEDELKSVFAGMLFIDLCIRTHYRELTVKTLVDAGIRVYVFGKSWEKLKCKHPENLIVNGKQITSAECVKVIRNTKIALNTMPWFKDGAHDRVFTAMLNKAVALTDESIYLKDELKDGKNVAFYQLERIEELPQKVCYLLEHPDAAKRMIEQAYPLAIEKHTWKKRAQVLREYLN